jgi:hypothetical protein
MRTRTSGCLIAFALLTWLSASVGVWTTPAQGAGPRPGSASAPSGVASRAFVRQYCVSCHSDRLKTAGLTLESLDPADAPAHADVWEKVIRKLRGRMMPPEGKPRPDDATLDVFVSGIERTLDRAAAAHLNPGSLVLHRLNRTEYGNAVRDLPDLADTGVASLLPTDDDSDGFDNVASVLKESPTFLEGYVGAARETARLALGDASGPPTVSVYRLPTDAAQRSYLEGMPLGTRGGILVRRYFPVDGEYKFDITLRQSQIYINGLEFPHDLVMLIDDDVVFTQTIGGEEDARSQDQQLATGATAIQARLKNLRFTVTAGPHSIAVTFRARTLAQSEEVLQPFFGTTRDHHPSGWMTGVPTLEKLEVMGPLSQTGRGDTASRRRILVCSPGSTREETACARTILTALARAPTGAR